MNENKSKEKFMANPVERHDTAAWRADIKELKAESKVAIPTEDSVAEAKDWVDTNSLS
ncbi:uncharacterized protein DUF3787 [Desulfitobacterium sp. LBE]|uniref:CDIF630_02480 family spore surface protein n=1 Tax=Desulfitobacterium TaxID=36853 RepID=UPI000380D1E9|nr:MULTISPECIES: DUF3787 domain-containing protein [Desulfitobacterium]TWH59213.1 uncharacterized protein DUF3787 [Desulfitobacterium sp. LBE]